MSDRKNDNKFTGIDWDGDGRIGWYDEQCDKEFYKKRSSNLTTSEYKNACIVIGLVIAGFVIGMAIPTVGAMILVGLWCFGFRMLISWIFGN